VIDGEAPVVQRSVLRPRVAGVEVLGAHARARGDGAEHPDDAERLEAVGVLQRLAQQRRGRLGAAEAVRADGRSHPARGLLVEPQLQQPLGGHGLALLTGERAVGVVLGQVHHVVQQRRGDHLARVHGSAAELQAHARHAQGMLHINSDHLYVECLESEPFTGQGNLVITELNNLYNPLIRYQLGDLGAISEEECSCGCAFPVLKALSGREGNFITTPSGRQVFSAVLSYTFKEGVRQFQGIQRRRDELIVRIVREEGLSDALADHYKESLARTLGDGIKVTFEFVPRIEPEKSGKLRYFISDLTE